MEVEQVKKDITIYPDDITNSWIVECVNNDADGLVDKAIFFGSNAKRQAIDYAKLEYKEHRPFLLFSKHPWDNKPTEL